MFASTSHCTILTWRGTTVRLDPPRYFYVYVLHYHTAYYHAQHYTGCTGALEYRLICHKAGTSGACLPQAFHNAGIPFTLARLWRFESAEEAFSFERKIKRAGHGPRYCPICRGLPIDDDVFMRQGHRHFHTQQARPRRPMPGGRLL